MLQARPRNHSLTAPRSAVSVTDSPYPQPVSLVPALDGQRVKVSKNPACSAPVYRQGAGRLDGPEARAIHEIGEEPVDVNWSGYYHQLRAEGVIIVEFGNDARG